jgi:hypothetical protein
MCTLALFIRHFNLRGRSKCSGVTHLRERQEEEEEEDVHLFRLLNAKFIVFSRQLLKAYRVV